MTVYVDDMRADFGRMVLCHMIADTDEELHAMADRIGVARRWHQKPPKTSTSHYDIALSKKDLAVQSGAVEVSAKQAACMAARRRELGHLGAPEDAVAWRLGMSARYGKLFREEGSGLPMRQKLFYVLSDSGSAYFPFGFETAEAAIARTTAEWPDTEVEVPKWLGAVEGWASMSMANVMLGEDLQAFWLANPL